MQYGDNLNRQINFKYELQKLEVCKVKCISQDTITMNINIIWNRESGLSKYPLLLS